MYIKQIIIEGFKSYGERTVVEPFDPRHNVVVGRNGSGKSNFFCAIQFVLSNEFTQLHVDQRQALLYEGSGPRVINASVEIIFDNSDRRLPVDNDNVNLKRVIGLKHDVYSLNKKNISRGDVMNLLESAGFSKSNPYYIVKQGKINQMAMTPNSRLKLLREIAGTKVYEEKRKESLLIFKTEKVKLEKIQDMLNTIDERLEILRNEMQELKEYQKWEKQHRSVEYIIHERILMEANEEIKQLEKIRSKFSLEQAYLVSEVEAIQKKVKEANQELKKIQKIIQSAEEQENFLRVEQEQLLREKAELKLTINDLIEEVKGNDENYKAMEEEFEKLSAEIIDKEAELQGIIPQCECMVQKEDELARELDLKEQKRKALYNKQGRGAQFKNKAERDVWIKQELKLLEKQIEDKKMHQNNVEENLKSDEELHGTLERKINEYMAEMDRQKVSIDNFNKQSYNLNKQKDELLTQRKDLYRQDKFLQDQLVVFQEDLSKMDYNLRSIFGTSKFNGKNSVEKVLDKFRERSNMTEEISKYCGLVIEIFDCDEKLYKAVEVTAGSRLFDHVVETNEFANKIMKEMNNQHYPGEVTFMPLDRLNVAIISYPKESNAFPLLSKLAYEQKYEKSLRYIFGRTLVCRDLEIAAKLSRKHNLDCVTLEGDQVSSKGWLKGGYLKNLKSPMKTHKERSEILNKINSSQNALSDLKKKIKNIDNDITSCISEVQRIETKSNKARYIYDKVKDEMNMMKEEFNRINTQRATKIKSLQAHKSHLEAMYATKKSLENELLQDLTEQLSVSDQCQIDDLNDSITQLTKEYKEIFKKRVQIEMEKNKLENLLSNNLLRRKDQLLQAMQEIFIENKHQQLKACEDRRLIVQNNIEKNKEEFSALKEKAAATAEELKLQVTQIEELKQIEKDILGRMEKEAKELEKLISNENIMKQKLAISSQKIFELGAIPSTELYSKFSQMNTKQLYRILEETKTQLKKFNNVNQKASDQYSVFKDQRNVLYKRKQELDRAYEKIQQLMDVLQERKREAIEFTFKQVSKYFSEIFSKLVPTGNANLIMKTANGHNNTNTASSTDASIDLDSFTGIDVKVSFTGHTGETREMNQLSGGQKSLVALTLIFAIQKCDPAPFYLFDEIDQALDTEHRKAVAEMIHELSSEAQFITTTFRPELLEHANKFYGVKFDKNSSSIYCVTREEATTFLEEDAFY